MAWLRAIPKGANEPREKDKNCDYPYPDIEGLEEVLIAFQELGCARHGFNGMLPICYNEIEAYLRLKRIWFPNWFGTLLFKLSVAYAGQANISTEPACLVPYKDAEYEQLKVMRNKVHDILKGFF